MTHIFGVDDKNKDYRNGLISFILNLIILILIILIVVFYYLKEKEILILVIVAFAFTIIIECIVNYFRIKYERKESKKI